MVKQILISLFGLILLTSINAKEGCIDNSWHLTKPFDNKEYHYVSCTCPCERTVADRNRCVECRHFHLPGDQFIAHRRSHVYTSTRPAERYKRLKINKKLRKLAQARAN